MGFNRINNVTKPNVSEVGKAVNSIDNKNSTKNISLKPINALLISVTLI
jgi:hypothetical protein